MILCTSERPGMAGAAYHLPYIEAVEGKRHGYMGRHGVTWTRTATHPADPKCPECAANTQGTS